MKEKNYTKSIYYILLIICAVIAACILKTTSSVVLPLTIALLLALIFYPLIKKGHERFHIPWILCVFIILGITIIVVAILSNLLTTSLKTIISAYPKYEARFSTVYQQLAGIFNLPFEQEQSIFENMWQSLDIRNAIQNMALSLSSSIIGFGKTTLLIVLFVVFLLIELQYIHNKTDAALTGETRTKVVHVFRTIISDVSNYMSIKFIISLLTGILVALGCAIIKLDFPIIWGFIAFLANFIPTFGSIASSVFTIGFALLQFYPSWGQVIFTAVLMISVNMILGNIVEPRWEGKDLGLSPFIILVSLSLWGWMWGFVGMILAVPLTVSFKIVCENIPFLNPIAIFLGNYKSTFKKHEENEENINIEEKTKNSEDSNKAK